MPYYACVKFLEGAVSIVFVALVPTCFNQLVLVLGAVCNATMTTKNMFIPNLAKWAVFVLMSELLGIGIIWV